MGRLSRERDSAYPVFHHMSARVWSGKKEVDSFVQCVIVCLGETTCDRPLIELSIFKRKPVSKSDVPLSTAKV